jgi:DNA invertase Pin-like site-specific DNA recombinase
MSPKGTRVVGYVRVSTSEQADSGAGLAAQRSAIEAEVKAKGWILVAILEDASSGKTTKGRPGLDAALALLEAGGAEALVVAKLDRLSRSIVDFGQLLERAKANGWAVVLLDMQLDMLSPQGELMANMLVSFAQFERRLIGQRTKDGLAAKKAAGTQLGRPRNLPDRVVARIERERTAGASLGAIAQALNADAIPTAHGGAAWHASTVRSVLNR